MCGCVGVEGAGSDGETQTEGQMLGVCYGVREIMCVCVSERGKNSAKRGARNKG